MNQEREFKIVRLTCRQDAWGLKVQAGNKAGYLIYAQCDNYTGSNFNSLLCTASTYFCNDSAFAEIIHLELRVPSEKSYFDCNSFIGCKIILC